MDTRNMPTFGDSMLDIVVCIAFIYQIVLMYEKFSLHLRMSQVRRPFFTKVWFAVLLGSMAFFGDFFRLVLAKPTGMTALAPLFSSIPGVVITIVIWVYFVTSLKFKPLHALEIAVYTYLYFQTISGVTRLVGAVFFTQDAAAIDYTKYVAMYAVNFLVANVFFLWMHYTLVHRPSLLIVKGMDVAMPQKNLAFAIFQACFIYLCAALIMILIPKTIVGSTISLIMLVLFSAFSITVNSNRNANAEIRANEEQLQSIFQSMDQFGAVKHDFYNILQTYNGYFELGDLEACKQYHQSVVNMTTATGNLLDIGRHSGENPALVSLLINKHDRAGGMHTRLDISLGCPLSELPIVDVDICRVVSCLLDNAIEAAAESKEKRVSFAIAWDENRAKRMVVTNSCIGPINLSSVCAPGVTSKNGHQGIGLSSVTRIMARYPHCQLDMRCTDKEVMAVLVLRPEPVANARRESAKPRKHMEKPLKA